MNTQHTTFSTRRLVMLNPGDVSIKEIIHSPLPFGVWLKERRKALGLTCKELARYVWSEAKPCAAITIRKLESGERRPSRQLAELLAARLNVPTEEWTSFLRFARKDTFPCDALDTIDRCYELLDEREQKLFRRLGVFVGGCTSDEAEAVCNGDGDLIAGVETSLPDLLESLINQSLLKEDKGEFKEPRYRLPNTLREYALQRLTQSGEAEAVMRTHANYFLELAQNVRSLLQGPNDAGWENLWAAERANFRAASGWLLERGECELAWRLNLALAEID